MYMIIYSLMIFLLFSQEPIKISLIKLIQIYIYICDGKCLDEKKIIIRDPFHQLYCDWLVEYLNRCTYSQILRYCTTTPLSLSITFKKKIILNNYFQGNERTNERTHVKMLRLIILFLLKS